MDKSGKDPAQAAEELRDGKPLEDQTLETAAGGTFEVRTPDSTPEQKALEARARRLAAMTGEHPTQVLMRLLKESKGG